MLSMPVTIARSVKDFHKSDIELSEKYLGMTPFSSEYWVRSRIKDALRRNAHLARGRLLDIGCGNKPYQYLFSSSISQYVGIEYSPESGYRGNLADICGDAARLPFLSESFDSVLCTEVMEHLADPERAIGEISRVLRPSGKVFITAPFFYPVHDERDFFRYSPTGISELLERNGFHVDLVEPLSGGSLTLAILLNLYWFNAGFIWTKWLYPIGLLLRPILLLICFVVNVVGRMFESIVPARGFSFNHLTIGTKIGGINGDD